MKRPARKIATGKLKDAVYAALDGAVTDLDGNPVTVVEGIPRDGDGVPTVTEPFIAISTSTGTSKDTNTTTGEDRDLRIKVYSDYNGAAEVSTIASGVSEVLDGNLLDLGADFSPYFAKVVDDTELREPGESIGETIRVIVLTCKFFIQQT